MDSEKRPENAEEEEEEEIIDPVTLKGDLFNAVVANNTAQTLQYLEMKVPPTYFDQRTGLTALHWAAMHGNVEITKKLLQCGASEPYHHLMNKIRRAAKNKNKKSKSRPVDNKLNSIMEQNEDDENNTLRMEGSEENVEGGPVDETKGGDDYDDDDDDLQSVGLEATTDYSKNTPLLWATHCGHMRIIWLLLQDGYSPNDKDKLDNNAVHLAAAYGDSKILQTIINDGGNANIVNHYKNLPIDMAKNKAARDMLAQAMHAGASMTDEDRAVKHEQNMKNYEKMSRTLQDAINEAVTMEMQAASQGDPNSLFTAYNNKRINRVLQDAIDLGNEYSLDYEMIKQSETLLKKIEMTQELLSDILTLQKLSPIQKQSIYMENVYKLEKSIEKAKVIDLQPDLLQIGMTLILRSQAEYWLNVLLTRLHDVTIATDANEHDMNKLRDALTKGQSLSANDDLVNKGWLFLNRLDCELNIYRALKAVPSIRMPMENPPEGYYTEQDIGHVEETEGYPSPPAETGEYVWIPAETFTLFVDAITRLKQIYQASESLGANPSIIQEAKDRITKADKEIKQLENKEANDKNNAIEAAKKLAKKLKKGGAAKKGKK